MSSIETFCCDRMKVDLERKCDLHSDRIDCPDALIDRVRGGYGLIIHDGGGSVIEIGYCPWCGTTLPAIGDLDLTGSVENV